MDGCLTWCGSDIPVRIGATSTDIGDEASVAEVLRAFSSWQNLSCADIPLKYLGRTNTVPRSGNGVVGWIDENWGFSPAAIGVTTNAHDGKCLRSSMQLNAVDFEWTLGAPTKRGQVDAYSVLAHEAGHYFGLGHSEDPGSIMVPRYHQAVMELNDDDRDGLCGLYPAREQRCEQPCTDGTVCIEGRCVERTVVGNLTSSTRSVADVPEGSTPGLAASMDDGLSTGEPGAPVEVSPDGQMGLSCEDNEACDTGLCVEFTGRSPICSASCSREEPCSEGFWCGDFGGMSLCVPGGGPTVQVEDPTGGCTFGGRFLEPGNGKADLAVRVERGISALLSLFPLILIGVWRRRSDDR